MARHTPITPDATLILRELDIPGRTGPVPSGEWGINIAAVRDNFPRQGLQCRAGPWGVMGVGDLLKIFWGDGNQVLQETVGPDEKDKQLTLFIPAALITDDAYDVSYSVTRLGSTPEPSEVMKVFVKLTRPGGQDQNGDTPGHSELHMVIPQEILDGGIDQDNVAAGVPITVLPYPYMAVGDVVQLSWGGLFVLSEPLAEAQVSDPANNPIVVWIKEDILRAAGDSDGNGLGVAIEVYDVVDNRSEGWSAEQRVVVAVDQTRLEAPILDEAINNVLDLDKLGDADAIAKVWAAGANFKPGDIIVLRVRGTPAEGAAIDLEIEGEPLVSVPSVPELKVPNAALRQLAKAQVACSFRLKKADGSADLQSKGQFVRVIGELLRLKAPIAEDAQQGAIDPALPRTRIEIPFDASFAAGQAIKLFWLGTRPDFTTYLPDLGLYPISNGDIEAGVSLWITVPGEHLAAINGGKLELYYQLWIDDTLLATYNRVNATHAIRESIHAEMLKVGEPRKELPAPKVEGVVDGVLDPDLPGTTLTVEYLQTIKDDEVVYEWVGSKTGKASDSVKLSSFTAGKPVVFTIKAELIKGNEGGTVEASYFIRRAAGGISYSDTAAFSVGAALVLGPPTLVAPAINPIDALNYPLGVSVQVNFPEALQGDEAQLFLRNPFPNSPAFAVLPLAQTFATFTLDATFLGQWHGHAAQLTWKLIRGGQPVAESEPLVLTVNRIADGDARLPASMVDGATAEGFLNVAELPDTAQLRVAEWRLQVSGHCVWLRYDGFDKTGQPTDKVVWEGAPHASTSGLFTAAAKDWLKTLGDGSKVTLTFGVNFGKEPDAATMVRFPLQVYTVKELVELKPEITLLTGLPSGVEIPNGGTTTETSITLSGTASKGQKVDVLDGAVSKGQPIADLITGVWTLLVSGLTVAAHSFTAKALYGSGQSSAARTLTVTAVVAPTISSVKGNPSGVEIPNGSTTTETSITLSGTASKGQKVNVLDGAVSKGQPIADLITGVWTLLVSGLTVAAHSFTAKALYGSGQSSAARTLTVTAVAAPTISSVKGNPSGVEIPNGSTTTETSITLSGTASKGQKVDVLDGAVSKGQPIADLITGVWTLLVSGLTVAAHSFTAKALYGSGQSSAARTLTVTAVAAPTISSVKGNPSGVEIPNGSTTIETSITLSGTASKGQKVDVLDGAVSKGQPIADLITGVWTLLVSGLTVAAHSFTAKALYGSGQSSAARTLTVTAVVAPTISSVKGNPSGVEIPNGSTTTETSITLSGTASKGQKVDVLDGAVSKGQPIADLITGVWTLLVSGLTVAAHSFTAKALYGSGQSSAARTLTVTAVAAPTISSVKGNPSGVEIPNGSTTTETSITLSGTASKGQKVDVLDGAVSKGQPIADLITGVWTLLVSGLTVAAHSFTAKALYGSGQVSTPPRTLTVARELILDPTPMILNGFNISIAGTGLGWHLTGNDPAGTAATRAPTGGNSPFTYRSSHPNIASVDSNGRVRSEGNGQATIYVSDQHQTKEYPVISSNVVTYLFNPTPMDYAGYSRWVSNVGGSTITSANLDSHLSFLRTKYLYYSDQGLAAYRATNITQPGEPSPSHVGILARKTYEPTFEPYVMHHTHPSPHGAICISPR
jgi:hypothetical protein